MTTQSNSRFNAEGKSIHTPKIQTKNWQWVIRIPLPNLALIILQMCLRKRTCGNRGEVFW